MPTVWLVRNDAFDGELEVGGFISIGWEHVPDLSTIDLSTEALAPVLQQEDPEASPGRLRLHAGILRRFYREVLPDDVVVTPRRGTPTLRLGIVTGPYFHDADSAVHQHRIPVDWVVKDLRRDLLPDSIQSSLRSMSTLSRINNHPEFFADLVHNPNKIEEIIGAVGQELHTWLVGATIDGEDHADQFVTAGIWRLEEGLDTRVEDMRVGDRIAIKSAYTRKHALPFDNRGLRVSCMMIKARGTVRQILDDHIKVDWDPSFNLREWYFYTFLSAVNKLNPEHRYTPALDAFIFADEQQDISSFLADPFWGRYSEEESPALGKAPSFRSARPSVQSSYEAMDRWRQALINGTSLFTGEPLDYAEATSALVADYVEDPRTGEGAFLGKLKDQLGPSPDSAIQLAAELLFIYFLPMHQRSTGQSRKQEIIQRVVSWRENVKQPPPELYPALLTGIAPVGTFYQTNRWRMFGYLVLLTEALTSLPVAQRRSALTSLKNFRTATANVDDQSVWSMRFFVEHLLFPDQAISVSKKDDRIAMLSAFASTNESSTINDVAKDLAPNIRYGDHYEINLYAAPHLYEWSDLGEEARVWGEWAAMFLRDSQTANSSDLSPSSTSPDSSLALIDSGAARSLKAWLDKNAGAVKTHLQRVESHGFAFAIDELSQAVEWAGDPAEFLEAATALLGSEATRIPQLDRHLTPVLINQLGHLDVAPTPSPGEFALAALEALDSLGVAVSRQTSMELRRSDLALLAQQLSELDPAATDWPIPTQERFLDWRSGRGLYGPLSSHDVEHLPDEGKTQADPAPSAEPQQEEVIPENLDELARDLTFDTEEGRRWLETTRQLLHERGQIILQGPPGTGKTFVAKRLALFLAGHSSRVRIVQFHPATAYEDFVQGLRPKTDGSGGFDLRPGPLLQIAEQARTNPNKQHILIIDEINRANLPAVFGELYFLLEYRETPIQLTSGEYFTLPKNLFIIGTMNTADRSIASIDAALRRRFYIQDLRPEESPLNEVLARWLRKHKHGMGWLPELLTQANALISDEDQHVGPSHFLHRNLTEERARHAWKYTVLPTLREHFYGQTDRLESFDFDALKSSVLSRDVASD